MKIKGTDGVTPSAAPGADELEDAGQVEGARFDEALAEGVGEAGAAPAAGSVQEVEALLQAGELSGARAAEALVDAVVREKGALLGPEEAERLRAELLRMLEEDPALAAEVQKLS